MTRCAKFHHLFDEVGDFCGMSTTAISQYKAYREQVKKLVNLGIEEDFVFENFPEGPGRILCKIPDDETRTRALNYVAACLKRKEHVTEGDLRGTLKAWQEETGKTCTVGKKGGNLGHVSKSFTNVKKSTPDNDVKPETPSKVPPAEVTIPLKGDPDAPMQASLGASIRKQEMAAAGANQQHVHPGAICTVNPVVINDTLRQSPFVTAAQLKDGVAPGQTKSSEIPNSSVSAEDMKAKRIRLADELLECLSERFQMSVRDYLQYNHQNGEKTAFDVLYMGAEKMINQPKAPASSFGAVLRRS